MMDPKDRPTLGKERFAEIKAKVLAKRKAEAERRDRLGDQSPDDG